MFPLIRPLPTLTSIDLTHCSIPTTLKMCTLIREIKYPITVSSRLRNSMTTLLTSSTLPLLRRLRSRRVGMVSIGSQKCVFLGTRVTKKITSSTK